MRKFIRWYILWFLNAPSEEENTLEGTTDDFKPLGLHLEYYLDPRGEFVPCSILHLRGQLDCFSYQSFDDFVVLTNRGIEIDEIAPLILDLTRIDFVDSSGIGSLVRLQKIFVDLGVTMIVVPSSHVFDTLKLIRLDQYFSLIGDLRSAVKSLL